MDERYELDVIKIRRLRSRCGIPKVVRQEEVRRRLGEREKMCDRVDRKVLGWFRRMGRVGGERLAIAVWESEVEGRRKKCRLDGVEKA